MSTNSAREFIPVGGDDLAVRRSFYSAFTSGCPGEESDTHKYGYCSCEVLRGPERVRQDVHISLQLGALQGPIVHPLLDILATSEPVVLPEWGDTALDRMHMASTRWAVKAVIATIGVVGAVLASLAIDIATNL